jgi:pyruvate/2-oxoglutarate dehydrogenase complex dihydrolipoamide acyltransferase (E2) component
MFGGRSIRLSLPRRLVNDLIHFGHKIPTIPVQKAMNVAALDAIRRDLDPRPSWVAIFAKAFAQVSRETPEFRRAYLSFPWARLYEHDENIASIAVEREYQGENGVFFAHVHSPEKLELNDFDEALRRYKETPLESISDFRWSMRITRLPMPLRRFLWWYVTSARGYRKATWLGTFGVSVYSGLGAESLHPLSPLTAVLNYGVISPTGDVAVRIIYDHRVMDGATVARALVRLERVMNEEILMELKSLQTTQATPRGEALRTPRVPQS